MENQQQIVTQAVREANNVLVTVSANPSVDQLAACIGMTLALNKLGKHATAVFSGEVPSTIEFLQPEKTLEKNTDSLRDFIIALDKSKADKLRYKVEDAVVKIFITPYKTSINEHDLDFSQGDFNVDVVLAIGVHSQADLDQAITVHGRILHDAKVITINNKSGGELGGINWLEPTASSLSELASYLVFGMDTDKSLLDAQIATALLTGIVAETDRFSNSLTTPHTMSISAELMAAGANQQLVASKLQTFGPTEAPQPGSGGEGGAPKSADGMLEIAHDKHGDGTASPVDVDADTKSSSKLASETNDQPQVAPIAESENQTGTEQVDIATEGAPQPEEVDDTKKAADQASEEEPKGEKSEPEPAAESDDAPHADDGEEHTPEEKALLKKTRNKGIRKNSRQYLGRQNRRTQDDKEVLGMPDVAPQPVVPEDADDIKSVLKLPTLDVPLMERKPLEGDHAIEDVSDTKEKSDEEATKEAADTKATSEVPSDQPGDSPKTDLGGYESLASEPVGVSKSPSLSLPDTNTDASATPMLTPTTQTNIGAASALPLPLTSAADALANLPTTSPGNITDAGAKTADGEENQPDVDDARDAVDHAIKTAPPLPDAPQKPIEALNAQPLPAPTDQIKGATGIVIVPPEGATSADGSTPAPAPAPAAPEGEAHDVHDGTAAPPPIPPPFMPPAPTTTPSK